jgi:uncharacterized protein
MYLAGIKSVGLLLFEWDVEKARENLLKHSITFDDARTVFLDTHEITLRDHDHSEAEDRFITLGLSQNLRLLVVCYTIRDSDTIRIISARKATKQEQVDYNRMKHK